MGVYLKILTWFSIQDITMNLKRELCSSSDRFHFITIHSCHTLMSPIHKEAVTSAATDILQHYYSSKKKEQTIWVKLKNGQTDCSRESSSAASSFCCPLHIKFIQFSLNLVDGSSQLIGPEIIFFSDWLRVQTWEHKLESQTEGHLKTWPHGVSCSVGCFSE